jgi:hypothetical protein
MPPLAAAVLVADHLGNLPVHRRHDSQIDKISWATKQAAGLVVDSL